VKALLLLALAACGQPGPGAMPPVPPEPAKSVQLNQPGEMVQVELHPGYVTVVDFWGEHCGACVVVSGMLAVQVAHEPRVLIRKVDVGDGFTPVAKAYDIGALPHFRVFDKHKKLRYVLVGNDTLKAPEIAKQLAAEP
jgi:thiol-disulfide isomerase/thioredoxin